MRAVNRPARLLALSAALLALSAGAQAESSESPPPTPPPEATAPPDVSEPPTPPAAEPAVTVPGTFYDRMLTVDEQGRVYEGRARTLLPNRDVFERAGRMDLVDRSDTLRRRRTALAVSAGVLAVTSVAVGVSLIVLAPWPGTSACEANLNYYNEVCIPRYHAYQNAGSAIIAGGLIGASLLATLAYWSRPDVLTRDEMTKLVSAYNARLKKSLLGVDPSSLRVAPWLGPNGGGVAAMMQW